MIKENWDVPQLRFPGYVGSWKRNELTHLFDFFKGKSLGKSDLSNVGRPCILYGELYTTYNETVDKVYSNTNTDKKNLLSLKTGDILIPASGETPEEISTSSCLLVNDVLAGGDLNVLRPKNSTINSVFFTYHFNHISKNEFAKVAQGKSVVHLYAKSIKTIKVSYPNASEQKKIADFLTLIDQSIKNLEEKIRLLELQKNGIMKRVFNQNSMFLMNDVNDMITWKMIKLGDIAEINMGQSPDSSTYNLNKNGLPLIQGNADLKDILSHSQRFTSLPVKICEPGDILMTVRAPVGFIGKAKERAAIGRGVCSIRPIVNDIYLYYYLIFKENDWQKIEQGSTFTAISRSDIQNLMISLPPTEYQSKVADFLTKLDDEINTNNSILDYHQQLKKGFLHQMLL